MRKSVSLALRGLAVILVATAIAALVYRPDKALLVGTGVTAQTLCAEVFVSRLDPATVFAQEIQARPGGLGRMSRRMHYRVDRDRQRVDVDYLGHFASSSVFRNGLGCLLLRGSGPIDVSLPPSSPWAAPLLPEIAGPGVVEPTDPRLRAALDHAFAETSLPPHRWVRAVVVLKDGKVIAERYAPGIGVDTPLLGYSASKSAISSLVGVLVRQGKLKLDDPAPIAAWRDPHDPRHPITVDNLLRMTSGLAIEQDGSGFDPASLMLYTERDMAGYATSQPLARPPGTRFDYSDASAVIDSGIVRDAVGGHTADVLGFARRELFDPLGMRTAMLEVDATGTPVGATFMLASARDWAKLGELYARDGVIGVHRILPEGWMRYSARPTLDSNYGAGFWTAAGAHFHPKGIPRDMLFASGQFGQRVYVIPSRDLVIVRFGVTQIWPDFDFDGDMRLIREVLASLADH